MPAPPRVYDTAPLELAIRGAPRLICFALKITRIAFRRAESQALAAGSSARGGGREFSLIDVASATPEPRRRRLVPQLRAALANPTGRLLNLQASAQPLTSPESLKPVFRKGWSEDQPVVRWRPLVVHEVTRNH